MQVWQQRLQVEEDERTALQQRFDTTVASLQQSAAATTLLLTKHARANARADLSAQSSESGVPCSQAAVEQGHAPICSMQLLPAMWSSLSYQHHEHRTQHHRATHLQQPRPVQRKRARCPTHR